MPSSLEEKSVKIDDGGGGGAVVPATTAVDTVRNGIGSFGLDTTTTTTTKNESLSMTTNVQQVQQQQTKIITSTTTAADSTISSHQVQQQSSSSFVNQGLQKWEASRRDWLRHASTGIVSSSGNNTDISTTSSVGTPGTTATTTTATDSNVTPTAVAVPLDVDEIIDVLFAPRWRGGGGPQHQHHQDDLSRPPQSFPTNVPLPQMVDVLVDLWEAEGLDP